MKKIIILLWVCFLLFSCSENKQGQNVIEESTQIIDDYVNTLTWSVHDSKEVKDLIENNQQKLLDNINSLK